MNRKVKLLLILIVLIGAGIALSYYIPFWLETRRTTEASSSLAALHRQARHAQTARQATETVPAETETPATETAAPAARRRSKRRRRRGRRRKCKRPRRSRRADELPALRAAPMRPPQIQTGPKINRAAPMSCRRRWRDGSRAAALGGRP